MYHISGQQPVQYFNRIPRECESDIAYVLDPVVGTAATMLSVLAILKKVRCGRDWSMVVDGIICLS
jgi:uracil phosphoribosyltransferase